MPGWPSSACRMCSRPEPQREYRPVLLGALLQQHGSPALRALPPSATGLTATLSGWAIRWACRSPCLRATVPSAALLRQALACSRDGSINPLCRGHGVPPCLAGGHDALDAQRLEALAAEAGAPTQARERRRRTPQRRCCAAIPTPPLHAVCLACPPSRSMARSSGAWTACPCCAPGWRAMPGSTPAGMLPQAWRKACRVEWRGRSVLRALRAQPPCPMPSILPLRPLTA